MRCLKCRLDDVPADAVTCPRCGVNFPALLHDVLPPGTPLRGTDYRIEYAIGRGGFGITYRATHTVLDRLVAIKEFFPYEYAQRDTMTSSLSVPMDSRDTFSRGLERFIREGRILARLHHPNVVPVHDLFEERGTAYLVMDLIEGHTLKDELRNRPENRLPPADVKTIIEQVVAALETTHQQDVYHLDIKPDNVLLTTGNRAVLVDFGAARQGFANRHTQAFTMDYAPPEIFAGSDVGPSSDIFEMGILVFEMLTGARPPNALRRMQGELWQAGVLTEPWRSLVDSALQLRKEDRPPTIQAWWEAAFPPIQQQQPEPPRPQPIPRNPVAFVAPALAGVAALGLVGYGVTHWMPGKTTPTPGEATPGVAATATPAAPTAPTPDPMIAKNLQEAKHILGEVQARMLTLKDQESKGKLTTDQAQKEKDAIRRDCEKARQLADAVISMDPGSEEAWVTSVSASFYAGDYPGADERLKKGQKQFPKNSDLNLLRTAVNLRLKNR